MIRREGDRMLIAGPVTLKNVTGMLEEGLAQVRAGVRVVDLGEVTELDSSLLAATLAWLREAQGQNCSLELANVPPGMQTLADLYGVAQLLPVASPKH